MKIIAVNGSPRREGNSAILLTNAIKGAQENGAEVVQYDLIKLRYFGCVSCFACKELGGRSYGRCGVRDALTPLLDDILKADGLILSMPVYFGEAPGMVRSFLERLWFPGLTYSKDGSIAYDRRVPSLLIYTMNAADIHYYDSLYEKQKSTFEFVLGPSHYYAVPDTLQYSDYSRYASEMFDGQAKVRRHNEEFPKECLHARELGAQMAGGGLE